MTNRVPAWLTASVALVSLTWSPFLIAAPPATYNVPTVIPDFSQTNLTAPNPALGPNYCAPTAAADGVYWFGLTNGALVPGGYGPGAAQDLAVDNMIGPNMPPIPANSLAGLMGTSTAAGTTMAGLKAGWGQYLNANGGGAPYITKSVLAKDFPAGNQGGNLYTQMEQDLSDRWAVILCLYWLNGQAPGGYDNPSGQGGDLSSNIGHALTLHGYDTVPNPWTITVEDPGNNAASAHNWNGENAVYNVAITPTDFRINIGGATGVIYGYVAAIPEPATLTLLAASGLMLLAARECR